MWVAPVLSATGDLITAALYAINYHNLRYLKGMDGTVVMDSPIQFSAGQTFPLGCNQHGYVSGKALDVPYQNTGAGVRVVTVSFGLNSPYDSATLRYGGTSAANAIQANISKAETGTPMTLVVPATMIVPPGYWYKAVKGQGEPTIASWWECNLGS